MVKALALLIAVFGVLIVPFSILAVDLELLLRHGLDDHVLGALHWPFRLMSGGGVSWGLAVGAGAAAATATFLYRRYFVQRLGWVSESQYRAMFGQKG